MEFGALESLATAILREIKDARDLHSDGEVDPACIMLEKAEEDIERLSKQVFKMRVAIANAAR